MLYDLINLAQNITVPVVSISIGNVSRDESRVFNKIGGYYVPINTSDKNPNALTNFYNSPVPVNININMSIMTKFQSDMDQIISNFVPYNNPYIILSWKVPDDLAGPTGFSIPQEIRSEVLWSGDINLSYPTDINATEKYKITGDTSFTIKGWLFPSNQNPVGNIFYIKENFYATSIISSSVAELTGSTYTYPVSTGLVTELESISANGFPKLYTPISNSTNYGPVPTQF